MAHVVVIGAGLGGLSTAYELRHLLPKAHRVTLISNRPKFTFIPGLIPVAFGHKSLDSIQLDLAPLLARKGIEFIAGEVSELNPEGQWLTVQGQRLDYDYGAIATGATLATDQVPGLGPEGGYTHSVCTPHHALAARDAWAEFLENPGPLVVGAAPGAGCFGPAYEFVMLADAELRRRGLRDRVDITYVTPEPYIGHLGVKDVANAETIMTRLAQDKGIRVLNNAAITHVDPHRVHLADGQSFAFGYAMILPAFDGARFLREVPGLTNDKGFVPVRADQRHPQFPSLYALGVSVALPQPDATPVPIGLPKSGEMTEGMGVAVAHNIAHALGAIAAPPLTPTLGALCLAEFGATGVAFMANPVLPLPGERQRTIALEGAWVPLAKMAFEKYFMAKMRWGSALPWFEKVGLRAFGVSLVKPLTPEAATASHWAASS